MNSSIIWAFFFIIESFKDFKILQNHPCLFAHDKTGFELSKRRNEQFFKSPLFSADLSFVEGVVTTKVTEESEKPACRPKADEFMQILWCQMSHCNACTQIN